MAESIRECIHEDNSESEGTTINPNGESPTECPAGEGTTSSRVLLQLSIETLEATPASWNDNGNSDFFTL